MRTRTEPRINQQSNPEIPKNTTKQLMISTNHQDNKPSKTMNRNKDLTLARNSR
ncbi:hypothetical protein [Vulcanisaeta distributa]|uniref:hypothetical protein n=1 Tax=Vulcanisaeta distributa TaxID=164451 RepID=UPI000A892FE6|nr:hypothetical protein [Vulcanisaeta distributa]